MIEREFIKNKLKEFNMRRRIEEIVNPKAGIGGITFEKTPLGERVVIDAVKPGLVIGRGGETIKQITYELKSLFGLENPQIEVREITQPSLSAQVVAKSIVFELLQFGPKRFKPLAYKNLLRIMKAGAMGCELKLSGRIPSQRAKTWRFFAGYMKKCGDVAQNYVDSSINVANTQAGSIGVKVSIMLPGTPLPDRIEFKEIKVQQQSKTGEELSLEVVPIEEAETEIKKASLEMELTEEQVAEFKGEKPKKESKPEDEIEIESEILEADEKKPAKKEEAAKHETKEVKAEKHGKKAASAEKSEAEKKKKEPKK